MGSGIGEGEDIWGLDGRVGNRVGGLEGFSVETAACDTEQFWGSGDVLCMHMLTGYNLTFCLPLIFLPTRPRLQRFPLVPCDFVGLFGLCF